MTNQTSKTKRPAKPSQPTAHNDFYETMPMTMGSHYIYRDDKELFSEATVDGSAIDESRNTAFITLALIAVMTVAASALFIYGLQAMEQMLPAQSQDISVQ